MSAPTTSDYLNQTTPAAPSGDQNVVFQSDGATPEQSITAYPKTATSSLRGVVKPDNSTITVDGTGTISAAAPTGMATQAGVQEESYIYAADTGSANAYAVSLSPAPTIGAGSVVVFKAAHANTGASTLAVNGGSAIAIYKQVSTPLASGDILAGQIVTLIYDGTHWQIGATGAIPAGTLAPALRGTAGGSGTTGSSFTVTWPAGTLAGDLVVICCNHDYNLTCPSGWTQNDLTNGETWNGMVCSKVMTSGDITAGSVSISAAGSQDWAYIVTTFIGTTGGIRETDTHWDSGTGTRTVTTSSAVQATDAGLYFGSGRGAGTALSISRGVSEDTVTGTNSQSDLNAESLSAAGSYSVNFSYTVGAGSGAYSAVVIVEGVPLASVVASLNGLTGALTLIAGSNVTITPSGSGITIAASGGGGGGVSSVGLTVPSRQSVSGSPVTSSGTLAITDNTQSANEVFAGPASGSAAAPTFRALVPADLPVATTGALGAVEPDGTTITISAGVISAVGGGGGSSVSFGASSPVGATPTVVQSKTAAGSSLAFTSSVTSGNLLLVAYKSESAITGVTISDTLGTSYSLVASVSGEPNNMNVYAGLATASGANTVTIGGAPNNYDRLGLMEVNGATSSVDVTATSFNTSSPFSLAITTTYSNDFIFAAVAGYANANTFSFASPFTLDSQSNGADSNAIGHYAVSATGSYTLTVTITGGLGAEPAILVAMKASAPVAGAEGDIYFQTSTTPYTGFVYHSSSWHQF